MHGKTVHERPIETHSKLENAPWPKDYSFAYGDIHGSAVEANQEYFICFRIVQPCDIFVSAVASRPSMYPMIRKVDDRFSYPVWGAVSGSGEKAELVFGLKRELSPNDLLIAAVSSIHRGTGEGGEKLRTGPAFIDYAISMGADPTSDGSPSLYLAATGSDFPTMKHLIELGADLTIGDKSGVTPVEVAAYRKHADTVRVLVELGATFNAESEIGKKVLACFGQNE